MLSFQRLFSLKDHLSDVSPPSKKMNLRLIGQTPPDYVLISRRHELKTKTVTFVDLLIPLKFKRVNLWMTDRNIKIKQASLSSDQALFTITYVTQFSTNYNNIPRSKSYEGFKINYRTEIVHLKSSVSKFLLFNNLQDDRKVWFLKNGPKSTLFGRANNIYYLLVILNKNQIQIWKIVCDSKYNKIAKVNLNKTICQHHLWSIFKVEEQLLWVLSSQKDNPNVLKLKCFHVNGTIIKLKQSYNFHSSPIKSQELYQLSSIDSFSVLLFDEEIKKRQLIKKEKLATKKISMVNKKNENRHKNLGDIKNKNNNNIKNNNNNKNNKNNKNNSNSDGGRGGSGKETGGNDIKAIGRFTKKYSSTNSLREMQKKSRSKKKRDEFQGQEQSYHLIKLSNNLNCLCYQCGFIDLNDSKKQIQIIIILLERKERIHLAVPMKHLKWKQIRKVQIYFGSIDTMLLIYLPGYYFQLIDCSLEHDTSPSFVFKHDTEFCTPLPNKRQIFEFNNIKKKTKTTRNSEMNKSKKQNTNYNQKIKSISRIISLDNYISQTFLDLESQICYKYFICSSNIFQLFVSDQFRKYLKFVTHYINSHYQDLLLNVNEINKFLFENIKIILTRSFFREYIISGSYQEMIKNVQFVEKNVQMVIPSTTIKSFNQTFPITNSKNDFNDDIDDEIDDIGKYIFDDDDDDDDDGIDLGGIGMNGIDMDNIDYDGNGNGNGNDDNDDDDDDDKNIENYTQKKNGKKKRKIKTKTKITLQKKTKKKLKNINYYLKIIDSKNIKNNYTKLNYKNLFSQFFLLQKVKQVIYKLQSGNIYNLTNPMESKSKTEELMIQLITGKFSQIFPTNTEMASKYAEIYQKARLQMLNNAIDCLIPLAIKLINYLDSTLDRVNGNGGDENGRGNGNGNGNDDDDDNDKSFDKISSITKKNNLENKLLLKTIKIKKNIFKLFQIYLNFYYIIEELVLPITPKFNKYFLRLGFLSLKKITFLHYLHQKIFFIDKKFLLKYIDPMLDEDFKRSISLFVKNQKQCFQRLQSNKRNYKNLVEYCTSKTYFRFKEEFSKCNMFSSEFHSMDRAFNCFAILKNKNQKFFDEMQFVSLNFAYYLPRI
ncbi:gamma-secretase-activating protein [Anaeramoeba flamelloides]|uniref:Gamma-secretase-activating protein n=1 Tax=Anaeramoeba flamelloides TaxID=1746091 RepID=A0ABQ8Z189_9EUKA|nr:gamma-secretase-activating protein [Anaeramoeba flamelloides]